jgi:regulatory protein
MDASLYESLMRAAYRFVSYRPRSEWEIKDFLQKKLKKWKVAGQASVTKALERMRDLGYVDDHKFVSWWVNQRNEFRPKGRRALVTELLQKGIKRHLIEEVPLNELTGAQKAIKRKLVLWAQKPLIEQKKKVYTFLIQRGFSSDTIRRIIDEIGKKDYN